MTVAFTEKTVDGERVLVAETEDDFAQALAIAGDRPIEAPRGHRPQVGLSRRGGERWNP